MFISRKENGGLGFSQQYGLNVQYEVIPQRLFIGAEGVYAHISSSFVEKFSLQCFFRNRRIYIFHVQRFFGQRQLQLHQ